MMMAIGLVCFAIGHFGAKFYDDREFSFQEVSNATAAFFVVEIIGFLLVLASMCVFSWKNLP